VVLKEEIQIALPALLGDSCCSACSGGVRLGQGTQNLINTVVQGVNAA